MESIHQAGLGEGGRGRTSTSRTSMGGSDEWIWKPAGQTKVRKNVGCFWKGKGTREDKGQYARLVGDLKLERGRTRGLRGSQGTGTIFCLYLCCDVMMEGRGQCFHSVGGERKELHTPAEAKGIRRGEFARSPAQRCSSGALGSFEFPTC